MSQSVLRVAFFMTHNQFAMAVHEPVNALCLLITLQWQSMNRSILLVALFSRPLRSHMICCWFKFTYFSHILCWLNFAYFSHILLLVQTRIYQFSQVLRFGRWSRPSVSWSGLRLWPWGAVCRCLCGSRFSRYHLCFVSFVVFANIGWGLGIRDKG